MLLAYFSSISHMLRCLVLVHIRSYNVQQSKVFDEGALCVYRRIVVVGKVITALRACIKVGIHKTYSIPSIYANLHCVMYVKKNIGTYETRTQKRHPPTAPTFAFHIHATLHNAHRTQLYRDSIMGREGII